MTCPSKECHDNVVDLRKTVNEQSVCMSKKVSFSSLTAVVTTILVILGSCVLYGMAAEKEQNKEVSSNKQNIAVIKTDLKHIAKSQGEMKATIEKIERNQLTKLDLVTAIKEAANAKTSR